MINIRTFIPANGIVRHRMTTPLYPTFQKRISDAFEQLIKDQITPWCFLNSGKPMQVKMHDQKLIRYEGIGFEGSPRNVFWSRYIEPFMEEICINEMNAAVKMSEERNVDAKLLLREVEGLLFSGVRKSFSEMAKTDQRLRGRGYPEKVPLRSIETEYERMKVLKSFDAAIVKSGTSSLELTFAKIPMIVAYKINSLSFFILKYYFRIFKRLKFASITNIMLKREIIPEYIQENCTAHNLPQGLKKLFNKTFMDKQKAEYSKVIKLLSNKDKVPPSEKAAQIILK